MTLAQNIAVLTACMVTMRRQEQALIQQAVLPHRAAAVAADAGRGQLVGGVLDQVRAARDVAARGREAAARVLDERARDDVRARPASARSPR